MQTVVEACTEPAIRLKGVLIHPGPLASRHRVSLPRGKLLFGLVRPGIWKKLGQEEGLC